MKLTVKLDFGCGREIKVGTFSEIGRDTAFEFAGEFLSSGLDPAPFRLRADGGLKIYDRSGNMETFGLFDDSLPDGWGRRIVDRMFMKREGRLPTVTERLMCVGRSGKGALVYEPADEAAQAANEAFGLAALAEEAMAFDAGEAEDALQRLRKAGGSSGGARPKAYVGYNPKTGEVCAESPVLPTGFEHWIVKFNTRRDGRDAGETEYRYYEAARAAGADISPSRLVETRAGRFFMTRRFDRRDGGKLHMQTLCAMGELDFKISRKTRIPPKPCSDTDNLVDICSAFVRIVLSVCKANECAIGKFALKGKLTERNAEKNAASKSKIILAF